MGGERRKDNDERQQDTRQWTDRRTTGWVWRYLVLLPFLRLDTLHVCQFIILLRCHSFLSESCTHVVRTGSQGYQEYEMYAPDRLISIHRAILLSTTWLWQVSIQRIGLIRPCMHLCTDACMHLSIHMYAYIAVYLSIYPPFYLSIYIYLSIYPSVCLSVCLPVCLSICQYVNLPDSILCPFCLSVYR